jgi:hypothetical protein
MIIANFTPDDITYIHGGIPATIESGKLVEVEDKKGNFILNKFDKRGLVAMKFGDNKATKQAEAMEQWKKFWQRQVVIYNQDNERRKNTQREYVEPTKELIEHATKLGIELIGPWTIRQTDNAAVQAVLIENASLKAEMTTLKNQMSELINVLKVREVPVELMSVAEKIERTVQGAESQPVTKPDEPVAKKPAAPSADHDKLVAEFQMLKKEQFGEWVMVNLDRIQANDFPLDVRKMIEQKWERLIQGDFPVPLA